MEIIWTRHGADRQRQWEQTRGVTKAVAEGVLEDPDQLVAGDQGALIAQSRWQGGLLRVVHVETGTKRRDLTVYWTSQVERY